MKLHLPKQLFTALLSVLTLAAAPAALTLGSAARGAGFVDAPVKVEGFWADDYSFYFVYDGSNGQTVMFYRGNAPNDTFGYNGISVTENNGALTLTIGQGRAYNTTANATGIDASTTFAHSSNKLEYSIESGVVYFVSVTAASGGNMTPAITAVSTSGSLSSLNGSTNYVGKMNGQATIVSALNQNYALDASSLLWSGAATGADLGTGSNWKTLGGNEVATLENGNLIFDASSNVAKTVNVTGTVSVGSIQLYDNYTFNTNTSATLNVTNGISIASGKTLTFDVEKDITTTLGCIITGTGALTKTGAGTLILAGDSTNWTGDIIVSGGILKAGAATSNSYFGTQYGSSKNRKITVKNGATLDVYGSESYYHVVLEDGATITNTFKDVSKGSKALPWIELTGDATISAPNRVVLQKGNDDSGTFELDLNGHKLTKTGSNELYIQSIKITSGTIQVDAGSLTLASDVTLENGVELILNANAVLNNKVTTISGVTLTGSGTYDLGQFTTGGTPTLGNISLGDEGWTGAVAISTSHRQFQFKNLSGLSHEDSWVKVTKSVGYIDNGHEVSNNLILDNGDSTYAIKLDNGGYSTQVNAIISGDIKGTGNIVYAWRNTHINDNIKAIHEFTGNLSNWEGKFIRDLSNGTAGSGSDVITTGKHVVAKFTSGGDLFSASGTGGVQDAQKSGKLSVVIDATAGADGVKPDTNFRGSIADVAEVEVKSDTTFQETVDTSLLTVDAGVTATLNAAANVGTLSAASATIAVGQNTILTLGGGTAEAQVTHNIGTLNGGTGSKLHLEANAVLETISTVTGSITVTGSGVYDMGSTVNSNLTGWTDSANWTGTVKLSGATLNGAALNTFGNADSSISLSGVSGSLAAGSIASNILLGNSGNQAALKITSGTANGEYTFTGDIKDLASGSAGNIVITTSGVDGMTFKFSGDTSGWTGDMVIAENGGSQNIIFTGNATTVNNSVIAAATNQKDKSTTLTFDHTVSATVNSQITNNYWDRTGTLHLIVANTAQEGTTFTKQIEADTITVNESTKAAFEEQTKATALTVQEGATLSVATLNAQSVTNSGALNLGTAATITKAEDATVATMSKVQMSSAGIFSAATDSTLGSISNALIDLQKAAEFSISDMSLSNVSLKAAATGTELSLNNVTAEAVQLAAGQFTLGGEVALSEQTPATKSGGYTASFTSDQLNGITLNNASGAASLTVDLGELPDCLQDGKTYNITIALSGFSMAAYDGTGLLFAADSWLGKLLADQGASRYVSSGDVESATTLAANNNTVTVTYTAMTDGKVGTIITITGLTIPEPTTSTLSLLALAGLAARRRRQH